MKMKYIILSTLLSVTVVNADDSTLDAAIGGGLGGAVGAAIGNELGGREGAIVGGALGGGVGAALTTDDKSDDEEVRGKHVSDAERSHKGHPSSRFCPPGQAKKGRC